MKRPPGLWILLSAGVLWLCLRNVHGLRATALIFGKSTTTTTTTTSTEAAAASEEELATTEPNAADANDTKPTLTGVPQIDYVWDPNLPKELNGYNLSDYPFYERVPEDIDFKCDGLHDGFYASVAHKCQVYHHCLFGTRYDFLCANYTAFDQKTFICHFASEVDCVNSKKFWHRNDALYTATTTTTIKPFVIHTPPTQPLPVTVPPSGPSGPGPRRPIGGRRRPFRRRRPQFDYYEDEYYDYYEERPRSTRLRPRARPRPPVYEDDYDEEYADRYDRRGGTRRDDKRRPHDRRSGGRRKNKDRPIKSDYEDEDSSEDEDYKLNSRRKNPTDDSEEVRYSQRRKNNNRREELDKRGRRPTADDYVEDSSQDDSRSYERPKKNEERRNKPNEERTVIKPVSGTIYDRPRLAPKIKLPVPKNEADKYAYKPVEVQSATVAKDSEDYEDYEEDFLRKPIAPLRGTRAKNRSSLRSRSRLPDDVSYESHEKPRQNGNKSSSRDRSKEAADVYYDEYDDYEDEEETGSRKYKNEQRKKLSTPVTSSSTTATTTTTYEPPIEKIEQPLVRLVKKPFLPSRGGNPYSARGLQPVGVRALTETSRKVLEEEKDMYAKEDSQSKGEIKILQETRGETDENSHELDKKPVFKPSPEIPVLLNSNVEIKQSYKTKDSAVPMTTQNPKLPDSNINDDGYDVTLNDALNPTLPNLPVRGSPTGFSSGTDYTYSGFQRPRYEPVLSQANSGYVYRNKQLLQNYETPQPNLRDQFHFVNANNDYIGQYSATRENFRPRQVQTQTEVFYSRF